MLTTAGSHQAAGWLLEWVVVITQKKKKSTKVKRLWDWEARVLDSSFEQIWVTKSGQNKTKQNNGKEIQDLYANFCLI